MKNFNFRQIITSDKKILLLLSLYIFLLLFFGSKMSIFYTTNEWGDPNIYFNVAKGMVHGKVLYTEIFDHKGPLIFFMYALGYIISNTTFFGMFLIEVVSWLVMAYSVYFTARLFLGQIASVLITVVFSLFLVKLMKAGGSAEEFILIWECVSLYLFVKYFKNKNAGIHPPVYMLIHGMLCTMTILTKINLVMFWFFPLIAIFINILFIRNIKNLILNVLYFIGGVLLVSVPIIIYLYLNDALSEAFEIYINLNRKYSQIKSIPQTLILIISRVLFLFLDSVSLLVFPVIGLLYFIPKYIKNKIGAISLFLSVGVSYLSMFMAPMFQYYYPIPFLIFSILGLLGIVLYLKKYVSWKLSYKPVILIMIISIFVGISMRLISSTWIESYVFGVDKYLTQELYDEIKKEKNPTLLNLGFGLGNSLFTTCNIVPNVKYFVKPNLTYSTYPDLRDEQTRYIREKKIQFVLLPQYIYKQTRYAKVESSDEFKYYNQLPELKQNYTLILQDTIRNKIDENNMEIYYLYKRKE